RKSPARAPPAPWAGAQSHPRPRPKSPAPAREVPPPGWVSAPPPPLGRLVEIVQLHLVDIAPAPALPGLEGADDRVPAGAVVRGGVAVLRGVAAADVHDGRWA